MFLTLLELDNETTTSLHEPYFLIFGPSLLYYVHVCFDFIIKPLLYQFQFFFGNKGGLNIEILLNLIVRNIYFRVSNRNWKIRQL